MSRTDPDLLPWSRFWHTDLSGPVLNLEPADRWRWTALRSYIASHGTNGSLTIDPKHPGLAAIFGVPEGALSDALKRLNGVGVTVSVDGHGKIACLWSNWYSTQKDPGHSKRKHRARAKTRPDQTRPEQEKKPPPTPPPGARARIAPAPCPDCVLVLAKMNEWQKRTGNSEWRVGPRGTCEGLHARHQEHGVDVCLKVVRVVGFRLWSKPETRPYSRPATLFGPKNFVEKYLPETYAALEERTE